MERALTLSELEKRVGSNSEYHISSYHRSINLYLWQRDTHIQGKPLTATRGHQGHTALVVAGDVRVYNTVIILVHMLSLQFLCSIVPRSYLSQPFIFMFRSFGFCVSSVHISFQSIVGMSAQPLI